jgi:hypothetical protein
MSGRWSWHTQGTEFKSCWQRKNGRRGAELKRGFRLSHATSCRGSGHRFYCAPPPPPNTFLRSLLTKKQRTERFLSVVSWGVKRGSLRHLPGPTRVRSALHRVAFCCNTAVCWQPGTAAAIVTDVNSRTLQRRVNKPRPPPCRSLRLTMACQSRYVQSNVCSCSSVIKAIR